MAPFGAYSYRLVYGLYCGRSAAAARLAKHRKSANANARMAWHPVRPPQSRRSTWWSPPIPASRINNAVLHKLVGLAGSRPERSQTSVGSRGQPMGKMRPLTGRRGTEVPPRPPRHRMRSHAAAIFIADQGSFTWTSDPDKILTPSSKGAPDGFSPL